MNRRLLISLLLCIAGGIYITAALVERTEWFRSRAELLLQQALSQAIDGTVNFTLDECSLTRGTIRLKKVTCASRQTDDWKCSTSCMRARFSYLGLLCKQTLKLHLEIDPIECSTVVTKKGIAIQEPLMRLLFGLEQAIPTTIESLTIQQARCSFFDRSKCLEGALQWSSSTYKKLGTMHTTMVLHDAYATLYKRAILQQGSGTIAITSYRGNSTENMQISGRCPLLDETLLLSIQGTQSSIDAALTSSYETIAITAHTALQANEFNMQLAGHIDLTRYAKYLPSFCRVYADRLPCTALATWKDATVGLEASLGAINLKLHSSYTMPLAQIQLDLTHNNLPLIQGTIEADIAQQTAQWKFFNPESISLPWGGSILARQLRIDGEVDKELLRINHSAHIAQPTDRTNLEISGTTTVDATTLVMHGACRDFGYHYTAQIYAPFNAQGTLYYHDRNKGISTTCGELTITPSDVQISANFQSLSNFLPISLQKLCRGQGTISLHAAWNNEHITLDGQLTQAAIFLSHTHNMISGAQWTSIIDFNNRTCIIPSAAIQLYRGSIKFYGGALQWESGFNNASAACACTLDHCFVGWKNMGVLVSGNTLINIDKERAHLGGALTLNSGYIRSGIFSPELLATYQALHSHATQPRLPITIDLAIKTEKPLYIRNKYIATDAAIDIYATGSVVKPELSGTLKLLHGTIVFPANPLRITEGTLRFIPTQSNDPFIQIVAKGMIKRHSITVTASGTLRDPQITLDSMPLLSQEQISSLLLAGTQDASLNIVVPAIITHNLKTLLLNSDPTTPHEKKWYHTLLKPLTHVRFIPTFTDQTGRDGFKATLDISATDRLNARIEKNFASTEDTAWDIDYRISDELSSKIIKDEHGDLGGEFEFKLKF